MSKLKTTSYFPLLVIGLFIVLSILSQSIKIIPAGRTGVIFNLKGGVQDKALKEGIHFLIPFVQTLIIFDTRIITYTFSSPEDAADMSTFQEFRLGPAVAAKTNDGQIVKIEISFVTRMLQEKAPDVYQKLRVDYEPVLKAKASKIVQEIIARYAADALYTEEARKAVTAETKTSLAESLSQSGFELLDVLLRNIGFSAEYITAIERKQIAEQKAELARILKEIAEKEKKIAIIKGEAEAKALDIKGKAIQANANVAELEYLETIERSDKQIPVIGGLKGNTFINLDKAFESFSVK